MRADKLGTTLFAFITMTCALAHSPTIQAQLNDVEAPESSVEKFEPDTGNDEDLSKEIEQASPSPAETPVAPGEAPVPEFDRSTPDKAKEASPGVHNPYGKDVIFDWTKYQNATEVPHPFAEKGLIRITRDKTYIYRVDESEQKTAVQVRVGSYYPENLEARTSGGASTFADNYDQTDNPAFMADWEWQLWRSPIGKWGATAGAGAYVAQGNGHFVGSKNRGLTPLEVFTLAVIPVNLGAIYRLQIWDKQLFVPYGAGGGIIFGFGEFRDDNKPPKWGGSYGAYFAGGLAMNLTYFDAISKIQLDREYGINGVYLTAEYRRIIGMGNFDFSSDFANAGFLMEY